VSATRFLPVGDGNAIDSIAFVVHLSRSLSPDEVNALFSLQDRLKTEFPRFDAVNEVSMQLASPETQAQSVIRTAGVQMQRFLQSGKPEWLLKAANSELVVSCTAYTRWAEVWGRANRLFSEIAGLLSERTLHCTAVTMQVVDRFESAYERSMTYQMSDVFTDACPYITTHARESGPQWHVYQGWFENASFENQNEARVLNVLNLTSAIVGNKLNAVVDHTLQAQFFDRILDPSQQLQIGPSTLSHIGKAFEALHTKNKTVLQNTLAANQLNAIGMGK
jgi:uncharacterized protein (TIGR04255 family)